MSVNGIGAGYPAWRDMGKAQRNGSGTGFAGRMADADAAGSGSSVRNSVKTAGADFGTGCVPCIGSIRGTQCKACL